ncbi:MAG: protein kinase [Candidatus Binatia bacterium]
MAEQQKKIGKYEIIERVGSGDMGTVYKAKDPRLNRFVAIKVISPDTKVTDELRTRFFTEAQASAGLSHPNIVAIYDIDEEGDLLYTVMELLDGQDLRRAIAERTDISVEDKVSALMQLCGGLQHAHGKGIVHGNLKPGKIVVQKDGSAKLIDFGSAKMAAQTTGGVPAAALRYMSPEHAAGKADPLSDQYSLAAVFYELLSLRAPYQGDDAKQLLEQLKSARPPALVELDATIPTDLAKVIEKAMSKSPAERYPDLGAMRADLEAVQKRVGDEVDAVRIRLAGLLGELEKLDADVGKRLGAAPVDAASATAAESPKHLVAMLKRVKEVETRIADMRAKSAKLDKAEAAFAAGNKFLADGKFAEARKEFEAVVSQLPEYAAAAAALERARKAEEQEKNKKLARKLLDDARKLFEAKEPERCLGLLDKVSEIPGSAQLEGEMVPLRKEAEALKAQLEAKRLARQLAERARAQVVDAKLPAESQGAAKHAAATWNKAGERLAEGNKLFSAEKYAEASAAFEAAAKDYQGAADEARKEVERQRRAAEEAEAARRLKVTNEILAEARKALADREYARSQEAIRRAGQVPPPDALKADIQKLKETVDAAQQTELRAKKPSQTARLLMTETRVSAVSEGAEARKTPAWVEAEAKAAEGTAAFENDHFIDAHAKFEAAVVAYQNALEDARVAKQREKEVAEAARQKADVEGRLQLATRLIGEARDAMGRGDHALCLDVLEAAARVSPTPEAQKEIAALRTSAEAARKAKETADQAREVSERERQKAERARELVIEAVRVLHGQAAPESSSKLWDDVEGKVAEAHSAFAKENYPAAFSAYEAGLALCQRFEDELRTHQKNEAETAQKAAAASQQGPAPATPDKGKQAAPPPPAQNKGAAPAAAGAAAAAAVAAAANKASGAGPAPAAANKPAGAPTAAPAANKPAGAPIAAPAANKPAGAPTAAPAAANKPAGAVPAAVAAATASSPAAAGAPPAAVTPSPAAAAAAKQRVGDDAKKTGGANVEAEAEPGGGFFMPLLVLGVVAAASVLAFVFIDPSSDKSASQQTSARTAEPEVVAVAAVARQASTEPDAAMVATARAAADEQIAADAKAAQDKAAEDARALAEAKLAADTKAAADAKATELASATAATPAAPAFVKAYASVFNEPTDGKHSGGAWGACWRADLAAAQACAKASCDRTRSSDQACTESASAEPGGHCAVASAAGFGVSWGACSTSKEGAEGAAISGCRAQANRRYPGENASCRIAWSSTPK